MDVLQHRHRQIAESDAGLGIDVAADDDQFDVRLIDEQSDNRHRVRHDLQRFAQECPRHFQRRGPPIQQDHLMRFNQVRDDPCDPFLLPQRLKPPLVERCDRLANIRRPAPSPPDLF